MEKLLGLFFRREEVAAGIVTYGGRTIRQWKLLAVPVSALLFCVMFLVGAVAIQYELSTTTPVASAQR